MKLPIKKAIFFIGVLFFLIYSIILYSGCQDNMDDVELKEIWPLEEGNRWEYNLEGSDKENITIEVIKEKETKKENIEQKENAYNVYMVEFDFDTYQVYEYYSYDEEGLIWFQMDNPWGSYRRQPAEYLLKTPTQETEQWEWECELETITGSDIEYKGEGKIDQTAFVEIDIPLGKFEALKTERQLQLNMAGEEVEVTDIRHYVPEIGLVKQKVKENGHEQLYMVIDEYDL